MKKYVFFILVVVLNWLCQAKQTADIDFITAKVSLSSIDSDHQKIKGSVLYRFIVLRDVDSVYLDARNFLDIHALLDGHSVNNVYDQQHLTVMAELKKGKEYQLLVDFVTSPKKAMYFIEDQIWTQGQGMYTSNWLPSIDDVNDKIEFDISITYKNGYEVLANGILRDKMVGDSTSTWHYDMKAPMSSYLVAIAVGHYDKLVETSESGIPLEFYYDAKDSLRVEPTYRHSKAMFDFLVREIGVPYPWQIYKQVPVKDFLYSGMENTTLTIFSDAFMVDSISYNDRNYIMVNAHELAHQWFGDLVTATSGKHHWLQEGFATYYALLAERHLFGDQHFYWQLFENAQELIKQDIDGQSTSLLDPESSSVTFYKKGAWALHILREKVGDATFSEAVKNYLLKYRYETVETFDFVSEVEKTSGLDLSDFTEEWLMSRELPEDAMFKSLKKSSFMREYLEIDCEVFSSKCLEYPVSYISDEAKIKVIAQMPTKIDKRAFQNHLKVRQAIAQHVTSIPADLKSKYESLLDDKSYLTQESALYNLWVNFPEERVKYLEQTKNTFGFNNYNVRLLWLALNLNTLEYQTDQKQQVLNELIGYTAPQYNYELRMNAFNYLNLIGGFEQKSLINLVQATKHHSWQFQKFAKNLLEVLKKKPKYRSMVEGVLSKQVE